MMLETVRRRGKTNSPGWSSRLFLMMDFASSQWRQQAGHGQAAEPAHWRTIHWPMGHWLMVQWPMGLWPSQLNVINADFKQPA
jgi:hypothetical protein